MSTLKVDTIKTTGGETLLSDPEAHYVIEQWRLTANQASNNAVVEPWERVDDATSSAINPSMTESSGVFTFPSTGLWLVTAQINIYIDTSDGTAGALMQVSSNSGGAWDSRCAIYEGDDSSTNTSGAMSCLVNVTDKSTFRFQLATDALGTDSAIVGNTDISRTALLFERKGPNQ